MIAIVPSPSFPSIDEFEGNAKIYNKSGSTVDDQT